MKKQILYMCKICETQFSNEKEANACEKSHVRSLQVGGKMRDFTEEEAVQYKKSIDKAYGDTGVSIFDF